MAATNPKQPEREEDRSGRPMNTSATTRPARRSRWIWITIGVVVLSVIGVGGGAGGYILFAFSADQARRLKQRISAKRR